MLLFQAVKPTNQRTHDTEHLSWLSMVLILENNQVAHELAQLQSSIICILLQFFIAFCTLPNLLMFVHILLILFSLGHFFYTLYMDPMQACIKLKFNFVVRSFRFIFFMWSHYKDFFFFFLIPAIKSILKVYPNALTMFQIDTNFNCYYQLFYICTVRSQKTYHRWGTSVKMKRWL